MVPAAYENLKFAFSRNDFIDSDSKIKIYLF